jgi:nicotinamidase-related amidase
MKNRLLIVVDMQNDFVDGSLGTKEAQAIVPKVVDCVKKFDGRILFTLDTHGENYLETQEGKNLPVPHCIKGSKGWELIPQLEGLQRGKHCPIYLKDTFGSFQLAEDLRNMNEEQPIDEIELIGLCTDICVVSNALLIKAALPQVPIVVDSACCAGVTPDSHKAALATMKSCQIKVL